MVCFNLKNFINSIKKHNIGGYSAQCAYYTILSFIPFIILVVTLIQYTGISKEVFINVLQKVLPDVMSGKTNEIVQEVYSKSFATISISLIFALWSSGKGIYTLLKGLNNIYEEKEKLNFLNIKFKSILCTILMICIIILVLILSVFGNMIFELFKFKFNLPSVLENIFNVSKVGVYLVLFFIIIMIYKFVPQDNNKLKYQIPGAIIATSAWYFISLFFSWYLEIFKGFSVMYGSLTTIVLSMMWIYFCMYSILIGAEVNSLFKKRK